MHYVALCVLLRNHVHATNISKRLYFVRESTYLLDYYTKLQCLCMLVISVMVMILQWSTLPNLELKHFTFFVVRILVYAYLSYLLVVVSVVCIYLDIMYVCIRYLL